MKKLKLMTIFGLLFTFMVQSCKKDLVKGSEFTAAINLVNAVVTDGVRLNANFTGKPFIFSKSLISDYWAWDGQAANGLNIFGVPTDRDVPLKVYLTNDTLHPVYEHLQSFSKGDIYSLFIAGNADDVRSLLLKEALPQAKANRNYVRFVNLSPDSGPVSINLAGTATGSVAAALSFMNISDFVSYDASPGITGHTFQLRNALTGDILTEYSYQNTDKFPNATIVIRGVKINGHGFEVVRINH